MPDLTLAAAFIAGVLSFLSPCVLPVVPAYLGQLGALSVAGASGLTATTSGAAALAAPTSGIRLGRRAHVLPYALAFILGFGGIFTLLGVTASYAGQGLARDLPFLRQIGGVILIVLGLNLAGVIRLGTPMRSWRPLERFGPRPLQPAGPPTPLGSLGLGAIFALGWTPCIGPTLGAIFGLAATGSNPQVGVLFAAYSLGLGIPFLAMALLLDRAPAMTRPLIRHGRAIEVLGGGLVVLIGLAILFDWLPILYSNFARFFPAPA